MAPTAATLIYRQQMVDSPSAYCFDNNDDDDHGRRGKRERENKL